MCYFASREELNCKKIMGAIKFTAVYITLRHASLSTIYCNTETTSATQVHMSVAIQCSFIYKQSHLDIDTFIRLADERVNFT